MELSAVKHTIKLSTDEMSGCAFCSQSFGTSLDWDINHLVQVHGGVLLHIGSQSLNVADEPPYFSTVAYVGFENAPTPREPSARFTTQLPPGA